MSDLVGTCPKDFWEEWIAEGDAAGEPETGESWHWYTNHGLAHIAKPGDRFYVVAHGRLRGWAPIVSIEDYWKEPDLSAILPGDSRFSWAGQQVKSEMRYAIIRRGNAVACTLADPVPGFRGLRVRWWNREEEQPFENWHLR